MKSLFLFIASALLYLLAGKYSALAQPAASLRLIALEGNGAINHIPIQSATAPVIEVRDQDDRPVEGASVTFKAPASGPGATFANGQSSYTAITDHRGQAAAQGYAVNNTAGRFVIEVTASYENRTGRLLINQVNSMNLPSEAGAQPRFRKRTWILLGIAAAAGAGVGAYFGLRSNSPVTVSTGPIAIGGPR